MTPDPADPITYVTLRNGEKVRNSWSYQFWKQNASPDSGLLVLANQRVVALVGTDPSVFWDYNRPRNWVAVIDRDLPDVPPVKRSTETSGMVTLFIAGRTIGLRAALAYAAESDIEHGRTQATVRVTPAPSGPHEREVVIKEIVKVPCRYCEKLNLQAERKCASCGTTIG